MPNSSQLRSRVSTWTRESSSAIRLRRHGAVGGRVVIGGGEGLVGAADRAAGQAEAVEGLRRGDLVDQVEVDVDQTPPPPRGRPRSFRTCSWGRARLSLLLSPAAMTAMKRVVALAVVLEMVGQIGVEGDAVALLQVVAAAVDGQRQGAGEDDRGLAAAGLVHRRVAAAAGGGAGLERVQGDVGALPRHRRGQLFEAVAAALVGAAGGGAGDRRRSGPRRGAGAGRA